MSGGVTLSFGPRAVGPWLHLNGGGAVPQASAIELRLDRRTRLWRLPDPLPELPDGLHAFPASRTTHHPDEACQLFVAERHGAAPLRLRWEGPQPLPWADGTRAHRAGPDEGTIEKETAGVVWLRYRSGRFPVGIFPRNLLGTGRARVEAHVVRNAMNRIWNLTAAIADHALTDARWTPPPPKKARADVAAPGLGVTSGNGRRPRVYQELTRLDRLLWGSGGVVAAWQALMADPVVRLEAEHPVGPVHLARRPVYSGNRGPWTLPDGWSPSREDGDVRDRRVVRTGDTPPNRLAVGLARRVLELLWRLQAARPSSDWHGYRWLGERIRDAAEEVLAAPAFAGVRRDAPVPLDSPTLQLNARCRPLLEAWSALDRGLSNPSDLPIDDVMLAPLAQTDLLYEIWCFLGIGLALRADDWQERSREVGNDYVGAMFAREGLTVRVYASQRQLGDATETERWQDFVHSWSPARRPDGLILLEGASAARVVAWDAKYQPVKADEDSLYGDDPRYQAHAFRDAVRVHVPTHGVGTKRHLPPSWSLALYPVAEAEGAPEPRLFFHNDRGTLDDERPLSDARPGTAGVGWLPLTPSAERGAPQTPSFTSLRAFLSAYLRAAPVTPGDDAP